METKEYYENLIRQAYKRIDNYEKESNEISQRLARLSELIDYDNDQINDARLHLTTDYDD